MNAGEVLQRLELLVGAKEPSDQDGPESGYFNQLCETVGSLDNISLGDLNQLLLAAGFNRPSDDFHTYFRSLATTESGFLFDAALRRWRVGCMLHFGNFRYPYRQFSTASLSELEGAFPQSRRELSSRPADVLSGLRRIAREDTPLLGYLAGAIVGQLTRSRDAGDGLSDFEQNLLTRFEAAGERGLHNTYEYCTMPVMDVYVATSMRDFEDFFAVGRFVDEVFGDEGMSSVAFFDPTQSAHPDRIVKGIVEGLMLKRAAVTVYLAQEGDTLGKDSELAATLAQGKVVIAYVPEVVDVDETARHIVEDSHMAARSALEGAGDAETVARLLERAQGIDIELWLELDKMRKSNNHPDVYAIALKIAERLQVLYEKRAKMLLDQHPLGLQVNISSGVANGIIVCRTTGECRDLILESLEGRLGFDIEAISHDDRSARAPDLESPSDWDRLLIEQRTQSVHRVVIGDALILNSFWNWHAASPVEPDSVTPDGYIADIRGGNG